MVKREERERERIWYREKREKEKILYRENVRQAIT